MSIKLKVSDADKKQMANHDIEARVLNALLGERRFLLETKAKEILETNGLSSSLYVMSFNPAKDEWEAMLKPGIISVPTPGGNPAEIKKN